MTIAEAIEHAREKAEMHRNDIVPKENYHNMPWIDKNNEASMRNAEEHEQLAEWLEELKAIKDGSIPIIHGKAELELHDKEIYNKALDDFVKFASDMPTVDEEDGTIRLMWLEEMVEKLKVGGENE